MAEYIYMERNGIYIIDLQKPSRSSRKPTTSLARARRERPEHPLSGTKKRASDAVREEAAGSASTTSTPAGSAVC